MLIIALAVALSSVPSGTVELYGPYPSIPAGCEALSLACVPAKGWQGGPAEREANGGSQLALFRARRKAPPSDRAAGLCLLGFRTSNGAWYLGETDHECRDDGIQGVRLLSLGRALLVLWHASPTEGHSRYCSVGDSGRPVCSERHTFDPTVRDPDAPHAGYCGNAMDDEEQARKATLREKRGKTRRR